ncbi:multidrug ABC transporter ATPase [Subtercola boreus]|uniref:multidrug ABC transporter ATPase n=1 Tax=Subtercola boreus TaxID=120213 RepID=UPI001153E2C9|nr:multidrug ABC transporter ATPase [Subtercola boreus]
MTKTDTQPISRVQRILAYMVASAIGLSILAFLAVIIGTAAGMKGDSFSQGVWPTILVLPLFGLPLAIALFIALLAVNLVRRSREARSSR